MAEPGLPSALPAQQQQVATPPRTPLSVPSPLSQPVPLRPVDADSEAKPAEAQPPTQAACAPQPAGAQGDASSAQPMQ
eukprot:15462596-Alexandrium_andersonii.AAC.1